MILRNKKILLIGRFDYFGGTKTYFKSLADFYRKQEADIYLAVKTTDEQFVKELNLPYEILKEAALKTRSRKLNLIINPFLNFFSVLNIILREKPDLMVVSDWNIPDFIFLLFWPIKSINIVHTYPTKRKSWFLRMIIKKWTGKRKVFLTVSNFAKERILEFWLDGRKKGSVYAVYNYPGYEQEKIRKNESKILRVLTLGHVAWYKNPKIWIQTAKQVLSRMENENVEFVWAGDGELLDECRKLVDNEELSAVKFIGYERNIGSLYAKASVYFQPSQIESFGLSVAEAMRWQLPSVVSDAGGLPEVIEDGKTGFVGSVNDASYFAEKIVILLKNTGLRRKMGMEARKVYDKKFSEEVFEENMLNLHSEILKK